MLYKTHSLGGSFSRSLLVAAVLSGLVAGCGSPTASDDPISALQGNAGQPVLSPTLPEDPALGSANPAPVEAEANGQGAPISTPSSSNLDLPFNDPTDLDNVGSIVTMADTGLRVGVAENLDIDRVDMALIEGSWTHMQTCLSVVAVAPLVIVSDESIRPLSSADDILYHLDGSITASSTQYVTGTTIQISLMDLDGSLNQIGFNLRSIMGRYLWTSSGLPEREYPHNCASLR